jgi:Domain of unknown function (DUF4337)
MEIDPFASQDADNKTDTPSAEAKAAKRDRLNTYVAITVALLATFAGICKVKDDNIVQAMQQAQADKIDHWNYYQARNLRQEVAEATATQLEVASAGQSPAGQARYAPIIARYRALAADQATKKVAMQKSAEADQVTYDSLNYRDDQFDLSDALTALAISLLALTSLTHKRGLFWVALVATALGVLMGLAGLAGWHIHPDRLSQLLS